MQRQLAELEKQRNDLAGKRARLDNKIGSCVCVCVCFLNF